MIVLQQLLPGVGLLFGNTGPCLCCSWQLLQHGRCMQVAHELEAELSSAAHTVLAEAPLDSVLAALADVPEAVAQTVLCTRKEAACDAIEVHKSWLLNVPAALLRPAICAQAQMSPLQARRINLWVEASDDRLKQNAAGLETAAMLHSMPAVTSLQVCIIGCTGPRDHLDRLMEKKCTELCCTLPHQLAAAVAGATQLTQLQLSAYDCKRTLPPVLAALATAAGGNLRRLEARHGLSDDGMKQVAAPLATLHALTHLDLSSQGFGVAGAGALASALSALTGLQCLCLGHAKLGQVKAASKLAPALAPLTRLTALDLCFAQNLQLAAARAYAPRLAGMRALRVLSLASSGLCAAGAAEFGKHMAPLSELTWLSVNHSKMAGQPGLHTITAALPQLQHFAASCCGLGGAAAHALAGTLAPMTGLRRLDLATHGKHALTDENVYALAAALGALRQITALDLRGAQGSEHAGTLLGKALRQMAELEVRVSCLQCGPCCANAHAAVGRARPMWIWMHCVQEPLHHVPWP